MNTLNYILLALVLITVNEYFLIKKYIRALNDSEKKETKSHKFFKILLRPLLELRNWIDYKLLNNELEN